ncbi:hypothetical protein [Phenylobacterium sp.]|uniref:hypothetical protein n=1 Tax=Phenylobacterium sp. TaxID=1871053 RepID=UPI00289873A4|nr:hypothetical protein [Phenylobacterium sp.]
MAMDDPAIGDWRKLDSPADLFVEIWRQASTWSPTDRHATPRPEEGILKELEAACAQSVGAAALGGILDIVADQWPAADDYEAKQFRRGLFLAVLEAIDTAFSAIHPRTPVLRPSTVGRASAPAWLESLARERLIRGAYVTMPDQLLIPHGPLLRTSRGSSASCGDTLADNFRALTVAPTEGRQAERPIRVRMLVVGEDLARGVGRVAAPGAERLIFIPLAENADELELTEREVHARCFVDVQPTRFDPAQRLLDALWAADVCDLALAPELTMPEAGFDMLASALAGAATTTHRVLLAGSGLTEGKHEDGRAWNEARLLNGAGAELFRQRKVWPFGMARQRAEDYGLADPGLDGMVMEDVAAGDELVVADLGGLGRCVVLICQDIQARPLVDEVVRVFQPDWVLTPILDGPITEHGWCRQRAFGLSPAAQTRYVVANSLSLALRSPAADPAAPPPVGLVVGPLAPAADGDAVPEDLERVTALAQITPGSSPKFAALTWRDGSIHWRQITIGSA